MSNNEIIKNIYLLSPMQEGMLFHKLLDKHKNVYFEQASFTIFGEIEIEIFKKSVNKIIERYDVLRTIFMHENQKKPLQIVLKKAYTKICFEDISSLASSEKIVFINEFKEKDMNKGFNLSKEISIRVSIIKSDEQKYIIMLSFHHIILDGWSIPILFNELMYIYSSLKENRPLKLKIVNEYSNYIKWIAKQDKKEALLYWERYLEDYEQQAKVLQLDKPVNEAEYINSDIKFIIDKETTSKLENIAIKNKATVNTVFQTIWGILLQRYNNVNDVVFGTVVSGRPAEIDAIENMVGLFINSVPVRIKSSIDESFTGLLKKIQDDSIKSKKYEYVPLVEVQSNTNMKQKLIDNIIVFENYPEIDNNGKFGFEIQMDEVVEQTNYNFNIIIRMTDEIFINLNYNASVYDDKYVNMIAGHIKQVIKEVVENPEIKISEIDILSEEEKIKILVDFNDTKTEYQKNKTIVDLFEEQVEKAPNNIAVVCEGKELTYKELNEKSNGLARILREEGVKPDSIVGIMVDRSLEMIISIMGVLKSGGAYLPIDKKTPKERVLHVLNHSNTKVLITQKYLSEGLKYDGKFININELEITNIAENLNQIISSNNLTYVIYTSGTTGNPKGVMIEHKQVNNLIGGIIERTNINKTKTILFITTLSFDMCELETLFPLATGMKIVIAKEDESIDASAIEKLILENRVDVMQTTPSRMKLFMEDNMFKKALEQLKLVLLGGEPMTSNLAEELLKFSNFDFYNMYGPTETTVWSAGKKVESMDLTIGKPIQNQKIYILNKDLNIQPVGIAGELCIGGDGLGRGYLNNEGLTNEKFIVNPFEEGKKLYKTGDLARWRLDGEIEFLGRIDHQVKIRGYRIELSEIESKLLELSGIKEAVVIDKVKEDIKYLCAYYVSYNEYSVSQLRAELKKSLPEYMIPSYFINMEEIPLNNNGKIDRKLLPELDGEIKIGTEYEAPGNETEVQMVKICKQVLGLQRLGVRDNLFEVGSNSIIAVKICNEFRNVNINISIKDIFYYQNIRDIYLNCVYKENIVINEELEELEESNEISDLDTNEIKQNLIQQINDFNNTILEQNISKTYYSSAIQQLSKEASLTFAGGVMDFNYDVNIKLLKKSIVSVINSQSLLRSILVESGNKMRIQEYKRVTNINIPYLNLEKVSKAKKENIIDYIINEIYGENLKNRKDVFNRILYKIIIIKLSDKKYKLYMPFNHLISDGMSNEIIKVNILRAYSNNGILKEDNSLEYYKYVNQLMEGPKGIIEKEIMEKFNLDNFRESYKEYFHKFSNIKLINTIISIELTNDTKEFIREMQWNVSLKLFIKILEINFGLDNIPFVLINPGRSYAGNNYYNTIGEFIDMLPLYVKKDELISLDYVKNLLSIAEDKNINFFTLTCNDEFKVKYKNISNALKDIYTKQLNIPIFNYNELYDLKLEIDELTKVKSKSNTNEISTEISIRLRESKLAIEFFCEEQREFEIKEELENYISTLKKI